MKIVTDENVDFLIVEILRENNFEVIHIGEVLPGADDDEILSLSNRESAILLTEDKDFGELVFRFKKTNWGVILVRLSGLESETKAKLVCQAIKNHLEEMKHAFTVIEPNRTRIKNPK